MTEKPSSSHRSALDAAVASLPTVDDDSWEVPPQTLAAAGLQDDVAAARKFVLQFSLWAREAIARLPPAPAAEMEATDFNDYYKIVMSRVQLLYAQAAGGLAPGTPPPLPLACFQTQLRRRPVFKKAGQDSCSCVFDVTGSYTPRGSVRAVGDYETSKAAFRSCLAAVGARKFTETTLRRLIAHRSPKVHAHAMPRARTPTRTPSCARAHAACMCTELARRVRRAGGGH